MKLSRYKLEMPSNLIHARVFLFFLITKNIYKKYNVDKYSVRKSMYFLLHFKVVPIIMKHIARNRSKALKLPGSFRLLIYCFGRRNRRLDAHLSYNLLYRVGKTHPAP